MAKIQQLSAHVADLIAAGEVVERPASAAKELVENSIDAGAKNITVEIQNGGMTFLRVTDDGCGMTAEDARTAFLRHATSKLRTERDLEAIHTLGFRGEALAAICAVSRIDLLTKTADLPLGTSLHLEAGVITEQEDAGCPDGTTIIVRDLFYNTPARMKFMKTDSYESAVVISAVAKLALAHPDLSIRVIKDGKEEFQTSGDGQLLSAIRSVMGKQLAQDMVELNSHYEKYSLSGYISKPTATRGNRSNQIFFVNGRHVRSKTMCAALEEAYANRMMVGRFPSCVLHLRLPEHLVDVNVHPAKIEVKFINERDIFDCIRYGVQGALDKAPARVEMQLPKQKATPAVQTAVKSPEAFRTMSAAEFRGYTQLMQNKPAGRDDAARRNPDAPVGHGLPDSPKDATVGSRRAVTDLPEVPNAPVRADRVVRPYEEGNSAFVGRDDAARRNPDVPVGSRRAVTDLTEISDDRNILVGADDPVRPNMHTPDVQLTPDAQQSFDLPTQPWRVVGEVMDTYIIVEQGRSMLLIDKHAAHERLLFEKLRAQNAPVMPQLLLTPLLCTLEREQTAILSENELLLSEYGFLFSDYGDGTLAIQQIPSELSPDAAVDTLSRIALDLKNGKHASNLRDTLLHTIACKAAVKGGQHSDETEREAIVREVLSREDLKYCPHGRPICVELTDKQLEKQFKR